MQSQAARKSGLGRATKKVRQREDDPSDVGDMAVDRGEEAPAILNGATMVDVFLDGSKPSSSSGSMESLPGFSGALYKKCLLKAVGSTIGHVIKINENTDNGAPDRFACMTVNVDLRQPLLSKIRTEGKVQRTEYEGLPNACLNANLALEVLDRRGKVESYGSWMIIARKSRHPLRKNDIRENNVIGEKVSKSIGTGQLTRFTVGTGLRPKTNGVSWASFVNEAVENVGAKQKENGALRREVPSIPSDSDKENGELGWNDYHWQGKGAGMMKGDSISAQEMVMAISNSLDLIAVENRYLFGECMEVFDVSDENDNMQAQ
ncbi:hypothetical protein PVK06_037887 [Gossypium arboreum]|uniref:Uncharacterized protein n=1 Tax=Gossypium arboreum TaxID=29729 RepID=A0ABR0MYL1_GOSAR|nr:hypothetical protein PVK06_037887 [Gossypium arboreum]